MQHREAQMQCFECNTEMVFGTHPIETQVGRHVVVNGSVPHERCPNCGYYELDARAAELLELCAAHVALHDAKDLDPAALKFARKALGLSQVELAKKLGLTQETISRHETGALPAGPEYTYALAGLLSYEDQAVCGVDSGHIKIERAA